jgi:SAM-dependent methyltransferase
MSNINDSFFDGQYKEIWRAMIPPELTVKEVDFMMSYFNLKPGSRVLDIMCGYGRHAIALARQGIEVTAIDNLGDYIGEIQEIARVESLPLEAMQADAATYEPKGEFDLVICMGNSLNFFDVTNTQTILQKIANHLIHGGHMLINSWSIAEIVKESFKEISTGKIGGISVESKSVFLLDPFRIETETKMIDEEGVEETKIALDYIFSIDELEQLIITAGLLPIAKYSIPPKKIFSQGDRRIYFVSRKR